MAIATAAPSVGQTSKRARVSTRPFASGWLPNAVNGTASSAAIARGVSDTSAAYSATAVATAASNATAPRQMRSSGGSSSAARGVALSCAASAASSSPSVRASGVRRAGIHRRRARDHGGDRRGHAWRRRRSDTCGPPSGCRPVSMCASSAPTA